MLKNWWKQADEFKDKVHKILIKEPNLSVRSYNCFRRAGIVTVEDLIQKTEEDMSKIPNLGGKSLKELEMKLKDLSLSFRPVGD